MVQTIQKSERYQNDLKRFNSFLERLPDGQDKDDFRNLLSKLVFEVKKMDTMFVDMIYSNQVSSTGKEIRESLLETRKSLEKIISRYSINSEGIK